MCVLTANCARKILRGKGYTCIFCSVCSCFFFFFFFSVVGLLFCVGVLQYQLESCVIFSSLLSSTCALSHQHSKAKGNHDLCGTYSPISDKRAWQLSSYGVRLEQTQPKHSFTTSSKCGRCHWKAMLRDDDELMLNVLRCQLTY